MTPAESQTLLTLIAAGCEPGRQWYAEEFFGARTAHDNAHRRTLGRLADQGLLERAAPAWANNSYWLPLTTYATVCLLLQQEAATL